MSQPSQLQKTFWKIYLKNEKFHHLEGDELQVFPIDRREFKEKYVKVHPEALTEYERLHK